MAPGEKSAKRQCWAVGPIINVGPYATQGGGSRGKGGMEMTPPRARPTTLRSWDADMMTTTIVTVVLLPIRILALLLSLVDDNDDADVRMRMGGWGARGCCHRCLSARTLLNE